MKKIRNSLDVLSQLSHGVVPLFLIALFIPLLVLSLLGIVSLIEQGRWLLFSSLVALSTVAVAIPYWWLRKQRQENRQDMADLAEYDVEPSGQWSEFDHQVWHKLNLRIKMLLDADPAWGAMREHGVVLAMEAAQYYHPDKPANELAFSAPEFLLMVEEISRRYRKFLLQHVPFSEKIRLATLKRGYLKKDKLGVAKQAYDVYRVFRAMTPAGLIAEARGVVLGQLFEQVSGEVQVKLKRVLLQEVASVAIDLYSGRFALEDAELDKSEASQLDQERLAAEIEPLRVAVVGQLSAGKSSVINAIVGNMVAEVSALPSTERVTVYRCEVDGIDYIHLVDLPGIDGNAETNNLLLEQLINSDLVFWVLKANQPARQLDVVLKRQFDAYYRDDQQRGRKKPLVLALLNQVDKLQPSSEWLPPYDLDNPVSPKGRTIKAAADYNLQQLEPDEIVPIAVGDCLPSYNLERLAEFLLFNYQEGVNTQLNRRRLGHRSPELSDQIKRLCRLGEKAFRQLSVKDVIS